MKIIEVTGFRTPKEFFENTSWLERIFISEGVKQLQKKENERLKGLM